MSWKRVVVGVLLVIFLVVWKSHVVSLDARIIASQFLTADYPIFLVKRAMIAKGDVNHELMRASGDLSAIHPLSAYWVAVFWLSQPLRSEYLDECKGLLDSDRDCIEALGHVGILSIEGRSDRERDYFLGLIESTCALKIGEFGADELLGVEIAIKALKGYTDSSVIEELSKMYRGCHLSGIRNLLRREFPALKDIGSDE